MKYRIWFKDGKKIGSALITADNRKSARETLKATLPAVKVGLIERVG